MSPALSASALWIPLLCCRYNESHLSCCCTVQYMVPPFMLPLSFMLTRNLQPSYVKSFACWSYVFSLLHICGSNHTSPHASWCRMCIPSFLMPHVHSIFLDTACAFHPSFLMPHVHPIFLDATWAFHLFDAACALCIPSFLMPHMHPIFLDAASASHLSWCRMCIPSFLLSHVHTIFLVVACAYHLSCCRICIPSFLMRHVH